MSKNSTKEELLAAEYFQMVITTSTNNRQVQTWPGMQHRVINGVQFAMTSRQIYDKYYERCGD